MSYAQEVRDTLRLRALYAPEIRQRFRGVYRTVKGQYGAQITISKGVSKKLGKFDTDVEAARAFDAAAIKYRGFRAKLNFPGEEMQITLKELAEKVQHMRQAQNDYFRKGRTATQLEASRAAEKELDRIVRDILAPPTLFDEGD